MDPEANAKTFQNGSHQPIGSSNEDEEEIILSRPASKECGRCQNSKAEAEAGFKELRLQMEADILRVNQCFYFSLDLFECHIICIHPHVYVLKCLFCKTQLKQDLEKATKSKELIVMRYANSEKDVIRQKRDLENAEKQIKSLNKEVELLNRKNKTLASEKERLSCMVDAKVRLMPVLLTESVVMNLQFRY